MTESEDERGATDERSWIGKYWKSILCWLVPILGAVTGVVLANTVGWCSFKQSWVSLIPLVLASIGMIVYLTTQQMHAVSNDGDTITPPENWAAKALHYSMSSAWLGLILVTAMWLFTGMASVNAFNSVDGLVPSVDEKLPSQRTDDKIEAVDFSILPKTKTLILLIKMKDSNQERPKVKVEWSDNLDDNPGLHNFRWSDIKNRQDGQVRALVLAAKKGVEVKNWDVVWSWADEKSGGS